MCGRTTSTAAASGARVTISAERSQHPSGRPLKVTWSVLHGGAPVAGNAAYAALNQAVLDANSAGL